MMQPMGRQAVADLVDLAFSVSTADQTEVTFSNIRSSLTRFAASAIHQNVAEENATITVRAILGKRTGIVTTNRVDDEGVRRVVDDAVAIARLAREDPRFVSLPTSNGEAPAAVSGEGTIRSDPERRAAMAGVVCSLAREAGIAASGSVSATVSEYAVANSLGVFNHTLLTEGRVVALLHSERGSGYAEAHNLEIEAIDAEELAQRALAKATAGRDPIAIEPGAYTVVLEPNAVADILTFLSILGFGARQVREDTSFISGKLGQSVLGANITIIDDGHDPTGMPSPFDAEGMVRQRLTLVRAGVAEAVAYDSYYAQLDGVETTGHALNGRYSTGPLPINLFLQPGEASLHELIGGVERGILVTRFHYTIPVHPLFVIVTGMTRDGTFLIEHGEITRPVKNLRFTQSYVDALRQVEAVGKETSLAGEYILARVPALCIAGFNFTGSTD